MAQTRKEQQGADYYYWKGYLGAPIGIYATADDHTEYSQGAEDRKRERDDES